jgi:hypothetical protein
MAKSDKIMGITFQKMKNGMHSAFMSEVKQMLADENMPLQGFEKLIEAFNIAYAAEVAANGVRRKSYITDDMVKVNARREEVYASLVYHHESALRHYDETLREAARGISRAMKSIAYIHNASNVNRESYISNITFKLRQPKYAQFVEKMQLMGWLDALDGLNELYQNTWMNRVDERSKRGNGNVLKARKVTDVAYQNIVTRVHALITLNETEEFGHFIRLLNVYIAREKKSMAISAGWRKHNKEKDETLRKKN